MVQRSKENYSQLPGILPTVTSGFEFTTRHIWLILLPIVLDIFFWLGPRLNITGVVRQAVTYLSAEPAFSEVAEQMLAMASRINLFTNLSIPIIGVPALMTGAVPEATPLNPLKFELTGSYSWLILVLVLSFIGIGLTTIYLGLISWALKIEKNGDALSLRQQVRTILVAFFRLFFFALAFLFSLFLISLPLLPIAFILGLINSTLMSLIFGFYFIIFLVLAAYLSLSVPGIIYNQRPVFSAMVESIRLVYRNLLPTINLLLITILIIQGTNILWHWADNGSWLTLISIIGHSFISTGLAAAIFIFYRDRYQVFVESIAEPTEKAVTNG